MENQNITFKLSEIWRLLQNMFLDELVNISNGEIYAKEFFKLPTKTHTLLLRRSNKKK